MNKSEFLFAEDDSQPPPISRRATPWQILVVDDDREVHLATRLVLADATFLGRPLELLSAYSATEAKRMLPTLPNLALILLDVVMETDDAGLKLVRHIREDLDMRAVRIILRTGQPGVAPERAVIVQYDINDYKTKTELTEAKLFTSLTPRSAVIRTSR